MSAIIRYDGWNLVGASGFVLTFALISQPIKFQTCPGEIAVYMDGPLRNCLLEPIPEEKNMGMLFDALLHQQLLANDNSFNRS